MTVAVTSSYESNALQYQEADGFSFPIPIFLLKSCSVQQVFEDSCLHSLSLKGLAELEASKRQHLCRRSEREGNVLLLL